MVEKGWCHCEVNVLSPEVGRGGNALANDPGEAGMEKAWAVSQRPCTHLEMCLMLPIAQGTKCWSLSLWLQCPQSHSRIYTKARTRWLRSLFQLPSQGAIGTDVSCGYTVG